MSERHHHLGLLKQIRKGGLRGLLAASVSFAICPGDDIVAIGAALVPGGEEVVVHQGAMPLEGQYQLRMREVESKGRGSRKLPKPRSFKQ